MEGFQILREIVSTMSDLKRKLDIEKKTETLKRKMENLASREADVRSRLDNEERPGKKRKEEVKNWLKNFQGLSREIGNIGRRVATSTSRWSFTLGSSLDELITEAEKLHEEGVFESLTLDVQETRGYILPVGEILGQAFESNLEKIWDHLMSERVQSVGVVGMGGVGKTTLVKCINNRIVKDCVTFEGSCWVTMPHDYSVRTFQDAIAKHLRLELENDNDDNIRAGKLLKALSSRKFIIILDDVWEYYSLEKVGIPLEENGCKLILTSRKKDVLIQMKCDKLVEVTPLLEEEAWCLFRNNLRRGSCLTPGMEVMAKKVAKKCAGLPLGIVVLSRIMTGVDNMSEWRNILIELQGSNDWEQQMKAEVFGVLELSYQRLRDNIMQQCFLHIALYPEDEVVDKDELIQYFIDSELIERRTRRAKFDKGNEILNKLVKSCLLEEGGGDSRFVKMHDLVRNMVINMMCGCFMVKAGQQIREMPGGREWIEGLEKVSLMHNYIEEISPNASPQSPHISTLFLQRNPLISIPDSFFRHMQTLQILNLSFTKIKELPSSFSNLENLKALHLSYCQNLRSVPSLVNIRTLRTLNLYKCGIREMPHGLGNLHNLMYLNLGGTQGLERMQWPTGILPQLSHLQYLNFMEGPKIMEIEELTSLSKLEHLRCWFDNDVEFSTCMTYLCCHDHCEVDLQASGLGRMMVDIKIEM